MWLQGLPRKVAQDIFGRLQIHGVNAGAIKDGSVTAFDVGVLYLAQPRDYRWRGTMAKKQGQPVDGFHAHVSGSGKVRLNALRRLYNALEVKKN